MKRLLVTGYIFVLALFIMTGGFIAFGTPFNDKVAIVMCFGGGYICFERLCKMCGMYSD